MKFRKVCCRFLFILGACMSGAAVHAQTQATSTYKHITIDGSFDDWTGVPVAYTNVEGPSTAIQYENIYLANDSSNLYIRVTLYTARPNAFANPYDNIFIDADNNPATGDPVAGIGSEMLIQWGGGYQEKNGGFNEGNINNLGWSVAGSSDSTDFEIAISLGATYASDGTPVFANNTIALLLEGDNTSYANTEFAPPSGGLVYTFAPVPAAVGTNLPLISLTNSSWEINAAGTDLGTNWLAQGYDDTQSGWSTGFGLFGYTTAPATYPQINTPLSAGPNTYYFRTHFQWTNDSANLAFVITNYLSDGAVYYLNGAEINSVRMPTNTVGYGTPATGTNFPAGTPKIFGFDGSTLAVGDNILEVETHQAPSSTGDMVFGLSLTAETQMPLLIVRTNQPADQTVLAGQPVTFTSDILGSGPVTYQWYFDGTNAIAGATGSSYTIPLVLTNNAGTYSVAVTNPLSSLVSRAAVLTVSNVPISITTPLTNVVALVGSPVTLSVGVSGTPLIQYQWYYGGVALAGATNASYGFTAVTAADAGSFYVTISNPVSTTNTPAITLTVLADTIPPTMTNVSASADYVTVTFSKPVDPVTASVAANYTVSGGATVTSAVPASGNANQVVLSLNSPLTFGSVYTLNVKGVQDVYGNIAAGTASFTRVITIDGSFDDWVGLTPIYSNPSPSGNTDAADFANIYMYNDANYYYFYVSLWTDIDSSAGQFPYYVNMFFDTDNNPDTGYLSFGSDMLIQSGYAYQEKNGSFNDNEPISGLNWLCLPASPGTNFEFRLSLSATFADGTLVFPTNAIQFLFEGMTPAFAVENVVPADGGTVGYTNTVPTVVPPLPLGKIVIDSVSSTNAAIVWYPPGTLQTCTNLANPVWVSLPAAASPYVTKSSGTPQFFRLTQ